MSHRSLTLAALLGALVLVLAAAQDAPLGSDDSVPVTPIPVGTHPDAPYDALQPTTVLHVADADLGIDMQHGDLDGISPDPLEALVAPVALYPDMLLSHVIEASTTPQHITQAVEFLARPEGEAQLDPRWSKSIRVLLHVPIVLQMMDDSLAWATRLGTERQKSLESVVQAIQRVRKAAQEHDNLVSDDKLTVMDARKTIQVKLADPTVLEVPLYDPAQIFVSHTEECPPVIEYSDPITFPGYKDVEAGFNSTGFKHGSVHSHYYGQIGVGRRPMFHYKHSRPMGIGQIWFGYRMMRRRF